MTPDNTDAPAAAASPFLITFSGIDGAGKTTQIGHLTESLQKQGLRVLRLSFWDDVAVCSTLRAEAGDRAVDCAHANGTAPPPFAAKNNKHIRKWYLTAARSGLYILDVVRLRRLLASQQARNFDVVIFDRYIYDQVANVDSQSFPALAYCKALLKRAPAPDLALVLDASPSAAFARKPEYPLEFMIKNRQSFLRLRELVPQLIVVSAAKEEEVRSEIFSHISRSRLAERTSTKGKTEFLVARCSSRATEFP